MSLTSLIPCRHYSSSTIVSLKVQFSLDVGHIVENKHCKVCLIFMTVVLKYSANPCAISRGSYVIPFVVSRHPMLEVLSELEITDLRVFQIFAESFLFSFITLE